MSEDQDDKEEKFDFTHEGEALGYISLDQARVLAMRTARETPGAYGRAFSSIPMAFDVLEADETEDHYVITLSFRPLGEYDGRTGREQFFIAKEGNVAHRQVLALPRPRKRFPVKPVGIALALGVIVFILLAYVLPNIIGDNEEPRSVVVPTDTTEPATDTTGVQVTVGPSETTSTPFVSPTALPTPTPVIVVATATPILTATPTLTPVPTSTRPPTPKPGIVIVTATPLPTATPTHTLVPARTPRPTNTPMPTATAMAASPIKPRDANTNYFTVGTTKDEVLAVQGSPRRFTDTKWEYGLSWVQFQNGRVTTWYSSLSAPLNAELVPSEPVVFSPGYFTVGSTKDEVLAVQGSPSTQSTWF